MPVPVVWSEDCLRHEPAGEVWLGVREPGTEVPDRALVLRAALRGGGRAGAGRQPHDDAVLRTVHDPAAGRSPGRRSGRTGARPGCRPSTAGTGWCRTCSRPGAMLAGLPLRAPPAAHARAGLFCYDTMTLVGPGSWAAIRARWMPR